MTEASIGALDALPGYVSADSPLSPRKAFEKLGWFGGQIRYEPEDSWDADTKTLPPQLARHRRAMRKFAREHLSPIAMRVDLDAHRPVGELSPESGNLLAVAARAGLLSDLLPAPLGSTDPRMFMFPLQMAAALGTEELAAVDGGLMLLLCANKLGVAPIALSGDLSAIRRFLLPAFRESAQGRPHVFAFAITEPAAGSDVEEGHGASLHRPGVVARKVAGGYRLRGKKCYISGGDIAQTVVVFAALEGEGMESWTAFVVRAAMPGYRVLRTELKMGMRASGAAELELDDVFVPDDHVVLGLRTGWALNRASLNMSRLPVAAMGVGFARAATELALDFACRTKLGGKPLIAYQEVQLQLADMLAETQAGRAMVWAAALRSQPLQREASAAKVFCTDLALRTCTRAMDVLGNHAVLHAERLEKIYRDARLTQIFEGTNQINRLAMIEDVQDRLLATIQRLSNQEIGR